MDTGERKKQEQVLFYNHTKTSGVIIASTTVTSGSYDQVIIFYNLYQE
jgi:hypothetical protein